MRRYMTVSIDLQPEGCNISAWMSTQQFWTQEVITYPHLYTHMGDRCTWFIHSNHELSQKMVAAVGETADKICAQQAKKNDTRKLSNG